MFKRVEKREFSIQNFSGKSKFVSIGNGFRGRPEKTQNFHFDGTKTFFYSRQTHSGNLRSHISGFVQSKVFLRRLGNTVGDSKSV